MKILHLLKTNRFSGAENVVCQIIGMMKSDGNIESLYCSPDGEIKKALDERGISFARMNEFSKEELKRIINEHKPDVIHAHDMAATYLAYKVCGKIPFISHIHNNGFTSRKISLKSVAYYMAARKAKHIFWVSKSAFEGYVFHKSFEKKSSVLYNIIDVQSLYERMNSDPDSYDYDVSYVGRLDAPKNPLRLVEVIDGVVKRRPDTKIAIVGTGRMKDEVETLLCEKKLTNNVKLFGFMSNPLKVLASSKVMIMTSLFEGLPMCALEALALGVPVVGTPVDGLKEIITNGVNGFLGDDNEFLISKLTEIIDDCGLAKKLSDNAKAFSLEYNNNQKYVDIIIQCYLEALK